MMADLFALPLYAALWGSADPATLDLVRQTPINCLLVESRQWSAAFNEAAAKSGIATLALVQQTEDLAGLPERLTAMKFSGAALQGEFDARLVKGLRDSKLKAVELTTRTSLQFDREIIATWQGVWPGINAHEDGSAKAAPSGAPWIDTNGGFLRFARSLTSSPIWIAVRPPANAVIPEARYLQAIGDAAVAGGQWVVALDADLQKRLFAREPAAMKTWRAIGDHLAFLKKHQDWLSLPPAGQLALVQDIESGGLFSGSILDMIAVKHTPVRPVPARQLDDKQMTGAKMAVDVDPSLLDAGKKEVLKRFTRAGNTLLTAPPGWKFPPPRPGQITLDEKEVEKIDQIWKEVSSMTGRSNLGVRLFNVASMLSNLTAGPGGKPLVLWLINYSDFPVENVTAHVLGKYGKATLHEPGGPAEGRKLETYEHEEGTGVDIEKVHTLAALVLE